MTTAWAHLPNAKHIDRILVDIAADPDKWGTAPYAAGNIAWVAAYTAASVAAYDAARNAVYCDAWDAASDAAYNAAYNAARNAAYNAARNAALALVAYDDCAYLLNEKPEDVKMLALLGNPAAVLLYPACVMLYMEK